MSSEQNTNMEGLKKLILVKTNSHEEELKILDNFHNQLIGNKDYIESRIVLNHSSKIISNTENEVRLYIFDDSETDVNINITPNTKSDNSDNTSADSTINFHEHMQEMCRKFREEGYIAEYYPDGVLVNNIETFSLRFFGNNLPITNILWTDDMRYSSHVSYKPLIIRANKINPNTIELVSFIM